MGGSVTGRREGFIIGFVLMQVIQKTRESSLDWMLKR